MPFKKGQSGNPKGRPKVGETWTDILKEIASEKVDLQGDLKTRKEVIARRVFSEAVKGESWAINLLMDRMDGKPKQQIETDITSNGETIIIRGDDAKL